MCRIVGYSGNRAQDLRILFAAFSEASGCDPHLRRAGIEFDAHKDGWGWAMLDENGLRHYRSARPVYEDPQAVPDPHGRFHVILHSRLGSDQTLNGHVCAHPFAGSTRDAFLFFAHNGGLAIENLPPRMVDSEWAFGKVLEAGGVEQALPLLRAKTGENSALNLVILKIPRDPVQAACVQYLNYYKSKTEGRIGYYQMYTAGMPGGRAVFSSTIADLKPAETSNVAKAAFGSLLKL